ncbi:single-stranded DNA-binding protein [Acidovorax sp.]|jgi:single-stranded DNA-binding protein|uniref:single-stranded DNA-binding protein n=1 Tax=Acidovorax sp. TaxID=1872122 RepID=UPI00391F9878
MIDGLISGRLYGGPERRLDKVGKPYMVAKVRAPSAEGEMLFVNVIAFDDDVCMAMEQLHDGESISVAGSITPKVWTDKQGNVRPALDMVAHRVLSARDAYQTQMN